MLNANAFPSILEAEATAAARRLAIFFHHVDLLPHEIEKSRGDFFRHLNRNWAPCRASVKLRSDLEHIAFADGLGYLACLHSILYELKAFLDLLTRLLRRLVAPNGGPAGFNRGKVGSLDLSGGKLINWIAGQSTDLRGRDSMAALFADASQRWITAAVDARDALSHFRDLPRFTHMRISLSNAPETLSPVDILPPQVADGEPLTSYTERLRDELCLLISNVLPLAPNVKADLLVRWETAQRYLRT